MSETAIEFKNVWKKFKKGEKFDTLRDLIPAMAKRLFSGSRRGELQEKEFWALKDVSFQLKQGEALGIIGPNGAGKSTALKLITGILRPNNGSIKVNGRLSALIEVAAGFHPDLTGRENIYLNGTILGMARKEIDNKFEEIVEFSGLEEFIDTPVKRYSSGMYARLGFSIAAHVDPEILLVDEVLSVGDLAFQRKCIETMLGFKDKGTTIIFVSHNLQAVSSLCGRCLTLNNGKVLYDGTTGEGIKCYYDAMSSIGATGPISIKNIRCLGENGDERVDFKSGATITLSMSIDSKEEYSRVGVGVYISSPAGLSIFNTNTARLNSETFTLKPYLQLKVTCHLRMNLSPGLYLLGVHLFDYGRYKDIFMGNISNIVITEDKTFGGIANLEPRIKVEILESPKV
jgi:lipopolysaccharide transport system ATP-binding protein